VKQVFFDIAAQTWAPYAVDDQSCRLLSCEFFFRNFCFGAITGFFFAHGTASAVVMLLFTAVVVFNVLVMDMRVELCNPVLKFILPTAFSFNGSKFANKTPF
jgi:membrane protease YdiL (CAAX protease family)